MSAVDGFLSWNAAHAGEVARPDLGPRPARRTLVLTCMDARLAVEGTLGTTSGDIHVLRNAGGVVTDDVLRSIVLSERTLGVREIMVMQHTKCGLLGLDEARLRAQLLEESGVQPAFGFLAFTDLVASVRRSLDLLDRDGFVVARARGFVFDVDTGLIEEIERAADATGRSGDRQVSTTATLHSAPPHPGSTAHEDHS